VFAYDPFTIACQLAHIWCKMCNIMYQTHSQMNDIMSNIIHGKIWTIWGRMAFLI